jgi:hypothetical protein
MNEFSNGCSAMAAGFSAVSMEELEQVEGGSIITTVRDFIGKVVSAVGDVWARATYNCSCEVTVQNLPH